MSILQPILQILQYQSTFAAVRPVLEQFTETLSRAGLRVNLQALHSTTNEGSTAIEKLLAGEDSLSVISVMYKLELDQW